MVIPIAINIRMPGSKIFRLFKDNDFLLFLLSGIEDDSSITFCFLERYQAKNTATGKIHNRIIKRIFLALSFNPKFPMKYSVISRMIHPPLT
jgi:hypothetical protein